MNKQTFILSLVLLSNYTLKASDETNNIKPSVQESIKDASAQTAQKIHAVWENLKNRASETVDEITQQTAQDVMQEIIKHVKDDRYYKKAIEENPHDAIAWALLKGYALPKHVFLTAYFHCIAGDKSTKFKHWKTAVALANQHLNDEHEKAKNKPVA